MGDVADLWSLYDHDISNQTITVHLVFNNTTLSSQTFSYNNIVLSAYWQDDTTGGSYGFTAKNIHSSLYGVNVLSVDEGKAPIYDLNLLNMPGMDGELPISSDIKSKKKVVNFLLYGDSIEEAIDNLRYVSTWLSNERVSPNVPVTYSVVFDHDPTMNYEVILKDEIKVNQKANNLECELTWTIPDGVGRGTEPVVSGGIGSNPGMIKVYPLIEVISDGSGDIIITDNETGQILTLNETVAADTTLYFDCNDRTVIDSSDNDHTDNVDVDSTWISFYTDYHVTVTGGLLQQISYYPGY
jgi:phage-related protein